MSERDGQIVVLIDRNGLQRTIDESRSARTDYWERLRDIAVPMLLLRATSGWSPLGEENVQRYAAALPDVQVVALPTAHDLGLNADPGPLFAALSTFFEKIDPGRAVSAPNASRT